MEKLKPPQPTIIDASGVDKDGNLRPWTGFDKTTTPEHTIYGGLVIRQIGPMSSPELNPKRYSL